MSYHYQTNCGQYVLFNGDTPVRGPLDEVAIAFDKESGTLHKHGAPEMVSRWLNDAQAKFRAAGFDDMAGSLVMICGRFTLEDLNQAISCSGYIGVMYEKLQQHRLAAQDIFAEVPSRPIPKGLTA